MAALQYVDVPGYAAIIFRKTHTDLAQSGALMDRARSWLANSPATWHEKEKAWRFPSGASLSFGYLDRALDRYRYQSTEFQFCGFDELTQFREEDYRYVSFTRTRRLQGSNVPIRIRSASNPGGRGHTWVRQRMIEEGPSKGRRFIPAKLDDNPYLDRDEYRKTLEELDPVTRAMMLKGDWDARPPGTHFRGEWFETVDAAPEGCKWVRAWDFAATEPGPGNLDPDWTVGLLLGRDPETGFCYVGDVARVRKTSSGVEGVVRACAQRDGKACEIALEQEPGSSGKTVVSNFQRRVVPGYAVRGFPATGDKLTRARPVSAFAETGGIKLVRGPWIGDFLDELESIGADPAHDDQADALALAYDRLTQRGVSWDDLYPK